MPELGEQEEISVEKVEEETRKFSLTLSCVFLIVIFGKKKMMVAVGSGKANSWKPAKGKVVDIMISLNERNNQFQNPGSTAPEK